MATEKKKTRKKTTAGAASPFEAKASEVAAPKAKRSTKKNVKPAEAASKTPVSPKPLAPAPVEKKQAKPRQKASSAVAAAIDPFAEAVVPASPVKKPAAKKVRAPKPSAAATAPFPTPPATSGPKTYSAAFEALADVRLPALPRENRARLQMQSPTRLHAYWSLKENPWLLLRNILGSDLGNYVLVVKLVDLSRKVEEMHPCEAEGERWFDVDANTEYRVEVGFYATARPYFRVLHSNSVLTPRRSPSTRPATDAQWRVSANKFAEVLDVAGFSRDAFDVAMAGDDYAAADDITRTAFFGLISKTDQRLETVPAEDIRYAMISLAAGREVSELEGRVSRRLFEILETSADVLSPEQTRRQLSEHFDIGEEDFVEEMVGDAVFGASLVNFPRSLRTRRLPSTGERRYSPLSSSSLR